MTTTTRLESRAASASPRVGLRHRAFVLLLENEQGDILIQRRSSRKLGGGRWDVSAASHVRRGETYETAITRCIAHELGVGQPIAWRRILSYVYTEHLGEYSENEFCVLFVGDYDGLLRPNHDELDELRWVHLPNLVSEIRDLPVQYTGWLKETVARLIDRGGWR